MKNLKMLEIEIHYCECGCGGVTRPGNRYIRGHNRRNKSVSKKTREKQRKAHLVDREIRFCKCGCGGSKEVSINSTWQYFRGHNLRVKNPASDPEVAAKISKSNTGKKRSEESIEKQKESMRSSEVFEEAMKNRKPPREGTSTSLQARENMSNGAINRKITPEFRESRRQGTLRSLLDPEVKKKRIEQIMENAHSHKSGYISISVSSEPIFYRSSYEKDALLLLESKPDVSSITSEKVHIPYVDEFGKDRVYIPDFLITLSDGEKILLEVKPRDFVEIDPRGGIKVSNLPKYIAAQKWAQNNDAVFCIWTEDVLYNNSSTTTSLQEIVEATVASHFIGNEVAEGIVWTV